MGALARRRSGRRAFERVGSRDQKTSATALQGADSEFAGASSEIARRLHVLQRSTPRDCPQTLARYPTQPGLPRPAARQTLVPAARSARTGLAHPALQPPNIRRNPRDDGGPLEPLRMPLLGRRRGSGGGGALGDEEGGRPGAGCRPGLQPAGPPSAGSQEDVQSGSSASLGRRSRQGGSLLDMAG